MSITKENMTVVAMALTEAMLLSTRQMRHRAAVEIVPVRTHAEAPQSLADLKAAVWAGVLPISTKDSATSVYGAQGNFDFRVWHDLGHLHYGLDMNHEDELKLHVLLWADLLPHIPEYIRWECNVLYQADTAGQSWLHHFTGAFPVDQTEFCLAVAQDISTGSICVKDAVLRYVQAKK